MSKSLILTVLLFAFILLFSVIHLLRKGRIPVKYALVWILSSIVVVIVSCIPNLMVSLAKFLGFELLSNMVLCIFIGLLLFLTLILTVMMAGQKKKTTLLIQELSLLKKEVEDKWWNIY